MNRRRRFAVALCGAALAFILGPGEPRLARTILSPRVTHGSPAMPTAAVSAYIAAENAYRIANGITAMVAGQNVIDFADVAAAGGAQTFSAGVDAVILDGPRSQYAIQVDNLGVATIRDSATSQSVTVSGASYLVFDGNALAGHISAASGGGPVYAGDAYFILTPANAEIAELYAAVLVRQPDMGGLEYWMGRLAAGMSLHDIAQSFLNAASGNVALQTIFGGDPATMGISQYVTALYQNVLGRAPDPGGFAYWTGALSSGGNDAATVLANFTNASAINANVNVVAGATPAADSGWLINYAVTGGMADAGLQETAASVLAQSVQSNYVNTALINESTISTTWSPNANGVGIESGNLGAGVVTSINSPQTTILLSLYIPNANIWNSGDKVITAAGGDDSIVVQGSNNYIDLQGAGNIVQLSFDRASANLTTVTPATNALIQGYVPGSDTIQSLLMTDYAYRGSGNTVQLLTPNSGSPVAGATLNFGTTLYVLSVGNVGSGSASEVAAAANALYTVGEIQGTASLAPYQLAGAAENLTIIGQAGANTVIYQWAALTNAANHATGFPITSADTNGNYRIDASEIQLTATLIGVTASRLTAADFHL